MRRGRPLPRGRRRVCRSYLHTPRHRHPRRPQYRSAIFPHDAGQRRAAEAKIAELERGGVFAAPVVTTVEGPPDGPARFWPAEAYHQDHYARRRLQPYCVFVVGPEVAKLHKAFAAKLKPAA